MNTRRHNVLTRRDFLRGAAGAGVLATASWAARGQGESASASGLMSEVVLVRDRDAVSSEGAVNAEVIGRMLDDAVAALLSEPDPVAAWKRLVKPGDTVGIKSNVAGPPRTPPELEAAIKRRVMDAGVPEDNISIDDRGVLRNPVFRNATALINVRPMRSHHWSGVGSLLKNYIMFSDSPPSWHGDSCANLAGLWDLPIVKGKTRLNILVMLSPLFHSKGPHNYNKAYVWDYKGILVSLDPVAADATGLRIIEAKRIEFFGEYQPLPISPKHIQVAQDKFGLGIADPRRINIVKRGWLEDVLI